MKLDLCKELSVRPTANGFLVETPFSYFDNDRIIVFVKLQTDGTYLLTDNGEAAERLTFDGVDPASIRISEWLVESAQLHGVQWNQDEQELWMVTSEDLLAKAVFLLAESAAQLQAMTATRSSRMDSSFKDDVLRILREVSVEAGVEMRIDVPILPGKHFTVDAYFASKRPLAIVIASSRERLLEAELLWSTVKRSDDPTVVYAVVESHRAVGIKEAERAGYFTDGVFPFKDYNAQFLSKMLEQVRSH